MPDCCASESACSTKRGSGRSSAASKCPKPGQDLCNTAPMEPTAVEQASAAESEQASAAESVAERVTAEHKLKVSHKDQAGKGRVGSLENPEVYEDVPGHVIPIIEREFDDFDTEAARFMRGEVPEDKFIGFRLKQGVYGQRQPDVQMIRVKLPLGGVNPEQMEAFADAIEKLRPAAQGPHHDAREHPDPPHPAPRRGEVHPRDLRRRALLTRGLRQHDPQRHRRPLGRDHRGRALRHHPLRDGLRPLLRPPPGHPADAAQGEDGVHGHGRGRRDNRDPRHRLHPPPARRRPRGRDPGRRRHLDHAPDRPHPVRVRRARERRLPEGRRGLLAHLRPPGVAAREPRPRPDQGADRQDRHRRLPRDGRGGAPGRLGRRARLRRRAPQAHRRRGGEGAAAARHLRQPERRPLGVRPLPARRTSSRSARRGSARSR